MEQMDAAGRVRAGLLARRGENWQLSEEHERNVQNAVSGAISLLRSVAGVPDLTFEDGDDLDLCITCAWYLMENQRAEFLREYQSELVMLRLREVTAGGDADVFEWGV